jgi:serine/threonine protein kinase
MFEQIMAGSFDFPSEYWGNISANAKDFVSKLLVVDTKVRMTAEQALAHPWLKPKSVPPTQLSTQFSRRLQTTVTNRRQETIAAAIGADF